ncbi:piggyBac transposable element-derived protein 4-like [Procambarus clarkii]|uniref:piggyBac transposable element-derived protein 4-like n=1 Tax=Procambarus clarkii TaxID=6728 RepID=UPI0037436E28
MDPAPGSNSVTPKGASSSSGHDKISEIYRRYTQVKLTPTKIPGLLDAFSEVEYEEDDIEGIEPDAENLDEDCDLRGPGVHGATTTEEDAEGLTEEEEGASAPPPLTTRRSRGVCRPKPQLSTRPVTRRRKITLIMESSSDSSIDLSREDESEEDEPAQPPPKRTRPVRTRQPRASVGWTEDNIPPVSDDFTGTPGLRITKPTSALAYIQLFFTRALIEFLTQKTNLYASQIFRMTNENVEDIWKPVKVKEIARYLGLSILMGINRLPTMRMYWQTNKPWHARFFNMFMTSKRFQHIAQFFHTFNNNVVPVNNTDKLIKVRPVMDYLKQRFQEVYSPLKELCLDEGTMAWRGRLSFKVYNPNKPDKYGVKLYMLAESTTGYIYGFDVYSGIGKTIMETVTRLMRPLVNKGHHLYMDNYYNSVSLTEKLRELGVYTCGTIRLLRGAPKDLQEMAKSKLELDTTVYRRKDNTFLLLWKDKRVVSVITNLHNADTQRVQ